MNDPYFTRITLFDKLKKADNQSAWNEFCTFYWDLIIRWARQFGCSEAMAKDVFQETVIRLIRNMPEFEYDVNIGRFRGFLKTIVKRKVIDSFRKEAKYVDMSQFEDKDKNMSLQFESISCEQPATVEHDRIWLESLLKSSIRRVSHKVEEKTYQSFRMYVMEELPVEKVKQKLNISTIDAIYQHKSRFLSALKTDFIAVLKESGELSDNDLSLLIDKVFNKILGSVINGRGDLRSTVINEIIPEKIKARVLYVKNNLSEAPPKKTIKGKYLLLINNNNTRKWIEIKKKIRIGRSINCEINLKEDDISLIHASIDLKNNYCYICDENSTNGTLVNGTAITQQKTLNSGDIIQVGNDVSIIFLD
jgi:RNA polymerase sigma-70 factor, ECF subfamily